MTHTTPVTPRHATIREVGLRDGLRSIARTMPTAHWLDGETLHGTIWQADLPKILTSMAAA